jgi:hypothetical protein
VIRIVGAVALSGLVSIAVPALAAAKHGAHGPAAPYSASTAVTLQVESVPAIGLTGYSGTYGLAGTGPAGGSDQSNFPDPDGMLGHLSFTGPKESQTAGLTAPLVYDARTTLNTVASGGRASPRLLTIPEVQSSVRCSPPADARATVHVTAPELLGRPLVEGRPTTVAVTSGDLGLPKVRYGTVTATYTAVETVNGAESAHAKAVFTLDGDLRDNAGAQLYRGHLGTLTLGDVEARCIPATEPTTPAPSPTTAEPTPTNSPHTPTPTPTPTSPRPTITPKPPTPKPPTPPSPATNKPRPWPGPGLPVTGFPALMLGAVTVLLIVVGAALVLAARARRPR